MSTCTQGAAEQELATAPPLLSNLPTPEQVLAQCSADLGWIKEAKIAAGELRRQLFQTFQDSGVLIATAQFSAGAEQWAQTQAQHLLAGLPPETPPFFIARLGSFARHEMAPFSDMDTVVITAAEHVGTIKALLIQRFYGPMTQNLLERHGGITIDNVTANQVYSPDDLISTADNLDIEPFFQYGDAAALVEALTQGGRTVGARDRFTQKLQDGLGPSYENYLYQRGKNRTSYNVKTLLNLLVKPAALLASRAEAPPSRSTPERLRAFLSGPLGQRLAEDFQALLELRFRLHLRNNGEHDDVTVEDPEWALFKEIASRLDADLPALDAFLRHGSG